jgi:hypothetical protein
MRYIDRTMGVLLALSAAFSAMAPADAQMAPPAGVTAQMAGPYRVVLGFLPAEPFVTADQVRAGHVTDGMMVVGGAAPVALNAPSHPNHHLVFHIFDASGHAVQGAHVTISYASVAGDATTIGPTQVPVVEMQAVGKGPESTHYGNNVTLPPGTYDVTVTVNGTNATTFVVKSTP